MAASRILRCSFMRLCPRVTSITGNVLKGQPGVWDAVPEEGSLDRQIIEGLLRTAGPLIPPRARPMAGPEVLHSRQRSFALQGLRAEAILQTPGIVALRANIDHRIIGAGDTINPNPFRE